MEKYIKRIGNGEVKVKKTIASKTHFRQVKLKKGLIVNKLLKSS